MDPNGRTYGATFVRHPSTHSLLHMQLLIWLRIGTTEGSSEHANELSGSVKCLEVLE
jgi:hypothetical protein